jgi:FkbM family methyltransferase
MNFEDVLEMIYSRIIKKGDLVIDIGAHSGRHTKPIASLVGKTGKVLAFEPNPTARDWLSANVGGEIKKGIVSVFPYAVSNVAQKTNFIIANERPEESGLKQRQYNGPTTTTITVVETILLDSLLNEMKEGLTFIKLDVEGAEFDALKGAREVLKIHRPVVAFEFGEQSYKPYDVEPGDVYEFFSCLNYRIYSIHGEKLDKETFVNASKVQIFWDYLACPEESAELIENVFMGITENS